MFALSFHGKCAFSQDEALRSVELCMTRGWVQAALCPSTAGCSEQAFNHIIALDTAPVTPDPCSICLRIVVSALISPDEGTAARSEGSLRDPSPARAAPPMRLNTNKTHVLSTRMFVFAGSPCALLRRRLEGSVDPCERASGKMTPGACRTCTSSTRPCRLQRKPHALGSPTVHLARPATVRKRRSSCALRELWGRVEGRQNLCKSNDSGREGGRDGGMQDGREGRNERKFDIKGERQRRMKGERERQREGIKRKRDRWRERE